ncbi:hypothetical protein [Zunongwangia endophytica]|uniref:Uncharacterized protein n=1 Tax=Zunongwangia endophytica TaxID=1808945 RepID=A0ABV8H6H7_9FLAO|nr:hypothetical protein [Zunongwangia endophytica]MDN3596150.1 hypothetical protein [Zunongwangia endophytica]
MSNSSANPLFYVDNLQKTSDDQYTVDLHLPENFNYKKYVVVGNSALISDILKVQITVTGDKAIAPVDVSVVETIDINLSEQNFKYLKFKIVWKLPVGLGGGVGDPEDEETVGESVLRGQG